MQFSCVSGSVSSLSVALWCVQWLIKVKGVSAGLDHGILHIHPNDGTVTWEIVGVIVRHEWHKFSKCCCEKAKKAKWMN